MTHFVRNLTPSGTHQIARVLGERDYELLFEGTREASEVFLQDAVERDYPGLMNQP